MNDYKNRDNILVVTSSFPSSKDFGGHFILNLCNVLSKNFNIIVSTPRPKGSLKYEEFENIRVYRHDIILKNRGWMASNIKDRLRKNPFLIFLTPFIFLSQVLAIRSLVKKNDIRKIQSNWLVPSTLSCVLYKTLFNKNVKILCTIHGGDVNYFKDFLSILIKKWILKNIEILTVVSEPLKNEMESLGYTNEIYVYPMGINTQVFNSYGKNTTEPTVLFVGSIIKDKGIGKLIQAVHICKQNNPLIKLLVIGDGNLLNNMRNLVRNLNLEKNVQFFGRVKNEELPKYYNNAKILVLPSKSEGFSVTVSEALSSGLFCITSNLPVFRNLEKGYGFIKTSKLNDVHSLANTIDSVINNENLLNDQRPKAREFAVKNLDWSVIEGGYTNLLNTM